MDNQNYNQIDNTITTQMYDNIEIRNENMKDIHKQMIELQELTSTYASIIQNQEKHIENIYNNIENISYNTDRSQNDLQIIVKNTTKNNNRLLKSSIYFTTLGTGLYFTSLTPLILTYPTISIPLVLYGWYKTTY